MLHEANRSTVPGQTWGNSVASIGTRRNINDKLDDLCVVLMCLMVELDLVDRQLPDHEFVRAAVAAARDKLHAQLERDAV